MNAKYRKAIEWNGRLGFEVYWPTSHLLYGINPDRRICFVDTEAEAIAAVEWLNGPPEKPTDIKPEGE